MKPPARLYLAFLLPLALALAPVAALAQQSLEFHRPIRAVLADQQGGLFALDEAMLWRVENGQYQSVLQLKAHDRIYSAITASGTFVALLEDQHWFTPNSWNLTVYDTENSKKCGNSPSYRDRCLEVYHKPTPFPDGELPEPDSFVVSPKGGVFFTSLLAKQRSGVEQTVLSSLEIASGLFLLEMAGQEVDLRRAFPTNNRRLYYNGRPVEPEEFAKQLALHFERGVLPDNQGGYWAKGQHFGPGPLHTVIEKPQVVWDGQGYPHTFFFSRWHNAFYHSRFDPEKGETATTRLDGQESGREHGAFWADGHLWALHYFYRSPFYKGVALTKLSPKGEIVSQTTLDSSFQRNAGFHLAVGKSSKGEVLLSYNPNSRQESLQTLLLQNPAQLEALANRLKKEGNPRGDEGMRRNFSGWAAYKPQQEMDEVYALELENGEKYAEAHAEPYPYLAASFWGAGQWANYTVDSGGKGKNTISDSLAASASAEVRAGDLSFGLFTLNDAAALKEGRASYTAFAAHRKLLLNYEVQLAAEHATLPITVTDTIHPADSRSFISDLTQLRLTFFSQDRHRYTLSRTTFNHHQHLLWAHHAAADDPLVLDKAQLAPLDYTLYLFQYGWSNRDYMAKYETTGSGWQTDWEVGLGYYSSKPSIEIAPPANGAPIHSVDGTALMFNLDVERVWYKRFGWLGGAGGMAHIGWRLDYLMLADEMPTDSTDKLYVKGHNGYQMVRHGPVAGLMVNF